MLAASSRRTRALRRLPFAVLLVVGVYLEVAAGGRSETIGTLFVLVAAGANLMLSLFERGSRKRAEQSAEARDLAAHRERLERLVAPEERAGRVN